MSATKKDDLGDRMKGYEAHETGRRFLPMLPVYARIDGRGFSKFTKGMSRPFDPRMTAAMIETTKFLVKETHALMGYVQSDEISLCWKAPDYTGDIFFSGKTAKMTSVLASMAAAAFGREIRGWQPFEDRYPHFDARVLQLPLDYEVANMFLWRAIDARKNAISMAAQSHFGHSSLQGKKSVEMLAMMDEKGHGFEKLPVAFREGTFLQRVLKEMPNPHTNKHADSEEIVFRSTIEALDMPPFMTVINRTEVIFNGDKPVVRAYE
jgi:tRNA(His) guanylyltransferase